MSKDVHFRRIVVRIDLFIYSFILCPSTFPPSILPLPPFHPLSFLQSSHASEDRYRDLAKAKKAAEILSSASDFDVEYSARNLSITDQNGKPIEFPIEEKKNLVQGRESATY